MSKSRNFGFFQNSNYFTLCIKFKDFWIFSICFNKLLASNSKEFWIFHLKYFCSPVNDLYQNQGFLDFFQNSIYLTFSIKIKDFWIISLEIFFQSRDNDSCWNQGFLDFFQNFIY